MWVYDREMGCQPLNAEALYILFNDLMETIKSATPLRVNRLRGFGGSIVSRPAAWNVSLPRGADSIDPAGENETIDHLSPPLNRTAQVSQQRSLTWRYVEAVRRLAPHSEA